MSDGAEPTVRGRVLVVDDEPDILEQVEEGLLDLPGVEADTVRSYQAAREALTAGGYDVAILDIMGVNGEQLLSEFGDALPCIMLTGKASSLDDVIHCFRGGATLYLQKTSLADLPMCVGRVLESTAEQRAAGEDGPLSSERRRALWQWFFDRLLMGDA